jgi:hypothetical protein
MLLPQTRFPSRNGGVGKEPGIGPESLIQSVMRAMSQARGSRSTPKRQFSARSRPKRVSRYRFQGSLSQALSVSSYLRCVKLSRQ